MKTKRRELLKGIMFGAAAGLSGAAGPAQAQAPARTKEAERAVDVLVCGAGPAGIAAAWMAARSGRKTLLVERYGRIGGMAVQAMVAPLMGTVSSAWADQILARIGGRHFDFEFVDLNYADLLQEAGCQTLLHAWVAETLTEGRRVTGVRLLTKQGMIRVKARVTVDATGDGDVAFGAGAAFDQGRGKGPSWEADGLVQPVTIMFRVAGVIHQESMEAKKGSRRSFRLPDGRTWNEFCKEANGRGELPPNVGMLRTYMGFREDERVVNATQVNGIDGVNVDDLTRAEFEARRQVGVVMAFLNKHAPGFGKAYVSGMPAVLGVRETRRIRGDETLEVDSLLAGKRFANAVVRGASFPIDIHNPTGMGQAQGVSKDHPLGADPKVKPYDIPYGCLLPRGIDGLITAGRCISGSHEAMASYRVQVIAMGTGVAAGVAAGLAAGKGVPPRDVPVEEIQRVVFETGVEKKT